MLLVPAELRSSGIHGIGLFLLAPVKRGAIVWRFDPLVDHVYSEKEYEILPASHIQFLDTYATWHEETKSYMLFGDHMRHANHSENPNILATASSFGDMIAAHDLSVGDELTYDYTIMCDGVRLTRSFTGDCDDKITIDRLRLCG